MNILLTHGYFMREDEREKRIMKPYPPLGLLYISAYLSQKGYPHTIHDSTFSDFEEQWNNILKNKPTILAVYVNLMTRLNVVKLIKKVKSEATLSHTKIVLGGPEVRHYTKEFLETGASFCVIGEGEETMFELVDSIGHGRLDYEKIKGLAFLNEEGSVVTTLPRPLISNLDELPLPARDAIDMKPYLETWQNAHGKSMLNISTMRGCPYTCKWCSRAVYGGTYRRKSAAGVVKEMKWLKEQYNPGSLWFVDDVFTISHKWLASFAEELEKQEVNIPFEIITRADRMNEEVIKTLVKAGCFRVWIGAESGSQKVIDLMDRRVKVEQVRDMIELSSKYGIETGTFIMLGYPGETDADVAETLLHLKKSNPDFYTITTAYPIKGTPLYTESEEDFEDKPAFNVGTDRDIKLKMTYSPAYYRFALRWINNEMKVFQETDSSMLVRIKTLGKAKVSRVCMLALRMVKS